MAKFDFKAEELSSRDIRDMRGRVDSHVFYIVVESKDTSASSYDPIYGEQYEVFSTGAPAVSASYLPFKGSIIRRMKDSEMYRQGFMTQEKLTVDVAAECHGITWSVGLKVLFEDKFFRISSVDERGLYDINRVIIELDEVT